MKRVIALIISIAMIASLATGLAVTGFAAEPGQEGYTFNDDEKNLKYEVIKTDEVSVGRINENKKPTGDLIIPATVTDSSGNEYTVTSIGEDAFKFCSNLTSIKMPSSVITISNNAFIQCLSLTSITIPKYVTSIGKNAFCECKNLTQVEIPNGVKTIGLQAFAMTGLTSIEIPGSVESIGEAAFGMCTKLTNVTITDGVKNIGAMAFAACENLKDVTINATTPPTLGNFVFYSADASTTPLTPNGIIEGLSLHVPVEKTRDYRFAAGWSAYASKINATLENSGITINSQPIEEYYNDYDSTIITSDTNSITVDKITTETDTNIYIPKGKTLKISSTNAEGIKVNGYKLTIDGEGTLDVDIISGEGTVDAIVAEGIDIKSGTLDVYVVGTYSEPSPPPAICAINSTGNITITDGIVTAYASGTNSNAIYAGKVITISSGTVSATVSGNGTHGIDAKVINIFNSNVKVGGNPENGIMSSEDIVISNSNVETVGYKNGFHVGNELYLNCGYVRANSTLDTIDDHEIYLFGCIYCNGTQVTNNNYSNYFYGNSAVLFIDDSTIKSKDWVCFGTASAPEEDLDEEENDPEVELDLGNGPVTLKTSNKSVVFNDTKVFEVSIGDGDLFVPIDLSNTPVKLDGIYLNNDVYKFVDDSGKDIELINRFAKAEVYTNKEVGNNPLSLHLTDVSEIPGTCATAIQKKAMQTNKVYAEINYSFVSNGKPTENDAKIYVPVTGDAKVFYLFNENKIGIVPCEVIDGYCVFNRYFDGTYVVCAD